MDLKNLTVATAVASLLLTGLAPAASAGSLLNENQVAGVIVQYAAGVDQFAPNGEATGANLLRGEISSVELGGGLFHLSFSSPVAESVARSWVSRMTLDRRISWAELNLEIQNASLEPRSFLAPILSQARPASAVRALEASPESVAGSPDRARIALSWRAPARRYGAELVGYRIQYSSNGGTTFQTLISDTRSRQTRLTVSDGIRAGVNYRFRVRAITTDGVGANAVGAVSNTVSATTRTSPKPVYITSPTRVGPGNVSYLSQSLSDRGGFPKTKIRYRALATADGIESVETSLCGATSCRFPELQPDVSYRVEVFAINKLGTSSSNAVESVNDFFFPVQWYLNGPNGISMPAAWKYSRGDFDKVVAVIDTGIKSHQQIDSSLTRNPDGSIYGFDFVTDIESAGDGDGEDSDPTDEGSDALGGNSYHGTHVSGIIAADHDFIGTAGVAPNIKILPIRALGRGGGTVADLIRAVNWATGVKITGLEPNRFPVSVINLSLGAREAVPCSGGYASIFDSAIARGITVVVAAGNESRASLSFPANCPGVISVVATQALGDRAGYSNYGEGTLLSAPGGEFATPALESPESRGGILSSWVDELGTPTYRLSEGTSMAAPVVSGIVALMYSMQPNITPARVRSILSASAKPFALGTNCSISGGCGSGIVNAQLALALVSALR